MADGSPPQQSRGKHLPRVGGKHVPSSLTLAPRGRGENEASTNRRCTSYSWTVRDAAYAILQDREKLLGTSCGNSHNTSAANATTTTTTTTMFMSQHFEVDELLQLLRDEKKATIQRAFHTAATAAWHAIVVQQQQQQQQQQQLANSIDLPSEHQQAPTPLDALRKFSLERSFENREYTKRKGGKKDIDYVPPRQYKRPVSATGTDTTTTTNTAKATKKASPHSQKSSTSLTLAQPTPDAMSSSQPLPVKATTPHPAETITSDTNNNKNCANVTTAPKFTRNTPASSATALDVRFQSSRAIVCVAGCQAFTQLTPGFDSQPELDCLDVPQQQQQQQHSSTNDSSGSSSNAVNMGAVRIEAQALSERAVRVTTNAVRRSEQRRHSRRAGARYALPADATNCFAKLENPFAYRATPTTVVSDPDDEDDDEEEDLPFSMVPPPSVLPSSPPSKKPRSALTSVWQTACAPRLRQVLETGAGHAIYHDVQWSTRHGRLANVWHTMPLHQRYGPHLIVCTTPDLERWAHEFAVGPSGLVVPRIIDEDDHSPRELLKAIVYRGNARQRRQIRTQYFPQAVGWLESPFHVCITSYQLFLRDYLHFCQLPWESVLLDDGVAWMATKEQTATLATIFEQAVFAANDHHMGLAGTSSSEWDYSRDDWSAASTTSTTELLKEAWIGLTARHRIVTASTFAIPSSSFSSGSKGTTTTLDTSEPQQHRKHLVPVSALLEFVAPQFAQVAKEEWDRSKIYGDQECMRHFRKLVARSVVVHMDNDSEAVEGDLVTSLLSSSSSMAPDLYKLAMQALTGNLPEVERANDDPSVPDVIDDDRFVSAGLVANSRRSSLQWLGIPSQSWLRYELGSADFAPILEAIKISSNSGFVCEEITTASSTTSSGATGQVCGSMAYRLAVVCGRHFGSESGLRQHIAAHHAPAGTWLCRTCSSDCVTSQARTHHERTCGQPVNGLAGDSGGIAGAVPTVGQGGKTKVGVGKKKAVRGPSKAGFVAVKEERDPDGSIRVPGYRGVWVNPQGKHFVKVDGKSLKKKSDKDKVLLFSAVELAAKKYDEVLQKGRSENAKIELNYNADGTRIVYDDIVPASTSSLGGSATTVVPSLSVINIKDLPPDVKPLLRDPRQTSRTGGNSKRHVYAYRGVCRQSRKGHDRWQSQISFMGTNHYLGTFDSEWDAAAIYAWAHLILYGEEATRQAQKEGEEAAAAYEQEQRDIAAGKIPEPPPKPEKKKKPPVKTKEKAKADAVPSAAVKEPGKTKKKRNASALTASSSSPAEKKTRTAPARAGTKSEKEAMAPTLAKGVAKSPILAPRNIAMKDDTLIEFASERLKAARNYMNKNSAVGEHLRPCLSGQMFQTTSHSKSYINAAGGAMLLGLSPCMFGWDLQEFVESCQLSSEQDMMLALQVLAVEYDDDGTNEKFRSLIQGSVCTIGSASETTQLMYHKLGLGTVPLGGYVGKLDCHIGGTPGSCSERAALIRYTPTEVSDFQFICLSDNDIVTINGQRLMTGSRSYPIFHGDICSVGARVFVFVLPARD